MSNNTLSTHLVSPSLSWTPSLTSQSQTAGYISFATLTAFGWDWLLSLADDIEIARKCGLTLLIFAYILSRTGMLTVCTVTAIFQAALVIAHCETLFRIGEISAIAATSATSFLFLVRIRAVYENSKAITVLFGSLWLVVLGTSILRPFFSLASHFGKTDRCMIGDLKPWTTTFLWVKVAYDTSIFFGISFRMASHPIAERTSKRSLSSLLRGADLPRFGRDLLHGGQLYYFVTIGVTLFGSIISIVPVEPVFRIIFTVPTLALESSMACRVFRAVILDSIRETPCTCASMVLTTFIHPEAEEGLHSSCAVEF